MDAFVALALLAALAWVLDRTRSDRAPGPDRSVQKLQERARRSHEGDFYLEDRLHELREYVKLAAPVFAPGALESPPIDTIPPPQPRPIETVKDAVRFAARRFALDPAELRVRFTSMPGSHAGSVRFGKGGAWLIDVDRQYEARPEALVAIVAHELVHVALNKRGIRLEPTQRNEELTDVTAVLAGFGPLLVRTVHQEEVFVGERQVSLRSQRLGYLPASALACLSALRVEMAGGAAEFYREHVPQWQEHAVGRFIVARNEWQGVAKNRRGQQVECHGCGAPMKLPTESGMVRVRCRTCSYRVLLPKPTR